MSRPRRPGRRPSGVESGAALVLALVFLVIGGLVLVPLVSLAGTNLTVTTGLQHQRNLEFGADTAMDGAIETLRTEAPSSVTAPTCPTFPAAPASSVTADGDSFVVECTMAIPQVPQPYYGRIVEFDACPSPASSFSACQSTAVVRTEVLYDDVASGCTSGSAPGCYGSSWGTGMTIESWVVRTAIG